MQLVIGSKRLSSWSMRPWLLMRKLGVTFDELLLPLDTPEFYTRIRRYSPSSRVPVLIDGEHRIWDSLAICEYVNERVGGVAWPSDMGDRAWARSVSMEMHSSFSGLRSCWIFKAGEQIDNALTSEAQRDLARIEEIWTECLTRHGGPWLFGTFSIADAMYAPVALRCATYGARLSAPATRYINHLLTDPHVLAWIEDARREPR